MLLVLVLGATADDGPLPPGASGAGMFWFRIGIGQEGSHGSAVNQTQTSDNIIS